MKKFIFPAICTFLFSLVPFHLAIKAYHEYDVESNTVQLTNEKGSCTGTQIIAPSGKRYVLTASHCRVLANKGRITANAPGKRGIALKIVEDSPVTDLMLLEGHPQLNGIHIASRRPNRLDNLRAYTHGAGMALFKAEGHYVQDIMVNVIDSIINTPEEEATCKASPKNKVVDINMFIFTFKACVLSINEYVTTVMPIMPGSSGGAVVKENKLIGVVSAGGDGFAYLVSLEDIKAFLDPY